jgi:uncharacterized membrane protein YczE
MTETRDSTSLALATRVVLLVTGSTIAAACYALTIKAELGLGPLFVLQDGVAIRCGFSIGTAVIVTGFALVLVAMALRSWPGPGTLALPVMGGVTLNLVLPHVPTVPGLGLRLFTVVGATFVMALGAAMMIRAAVGVSAYDAVMLGLCRVLRRPISPVRIGMETSVLIVGWALGGAVGVGTAITGLLIGPSMHWWLHAIGGTLPTTGFARKRSS